MGEKALIHKAACKEGAKNKENKAAQRILQSSCTEVKEH